MGAVKLSTRLKNNVKNEGECVLDNVVTGQGKSVP
jgi:hypothetical protein